MSKANRRKQAKKAKKEKKLERSLSTKTEFRIFVFERDGGLCRYCAEQGQTIDHLQPIAAGGKSIEENCAVACHYCNGVKGDKTRGAFEAWHASIGGQAGMRERKREYEKEKARWEAQEEARKEKERLANEKYKAQIAEEFARGKHACKGCGKEKYIRDEERWLCPSCNKKRLKAEDERNRLDANAKLGNEP